MIAWCFSNTCKSYKTGRLDGGSFRCSACNLLSTPEELDPMKCRCGGLWAKIYQANEYGCYDMTGAVTCGARVSAVLMTMAMNPGPPATLTSAPGPVPNNECKVCKAECTQGEKHVCVDCWKQASGRMRPMAGACMMCPTPTAGNGFVYACRPCFDTLIRSSFSVDTSGPPVPYKRALFVHSSRPLGAPYAAPVILSAASPPPTPPIPHTYYIDPFALDDDTDATPPPKPAKVYQKCAECGIEMSPYLDAYPGKNAYKRSLCVKCRDKAFGRFCNDDTLERRQDLDNDF